VPGPLYKLSEDLKDIEDNVPDEGELQMPSTHDMANAKNWAHFS